MSYLLRSILFLSGIAIVWLGLNVSLGGIKTLGWQGADDFISVTDPEIFVVQDNHTRFIAGVWMALGLIMIAGSMALQKMRSVLIACIAMIFVGGLSRFSGGDFMLVFGEDIAPSLLAELVIFPLVGYWVHVVK